MAVLKSKVEEAVGKCVEVTIFDGSCYLGVLEKSGEERWKKIPELYLKKNYYFIRPLFAGNISALFRASHITKMEIMDVRFDCEVD